MKMQEIVIDQVIWTEGEMQNGNLWKQGKLNRTEHRMQSQGHHDHDMLLFVFLLEKTMALPFY